MDLNAKRSTLNALRYTLSALRCYIWLLMLSVAAGLLVAGCAESRPQTAQAPAEPVEQQGPVVEQPTVTEQPAVTIALKFAPGDVTRYHVITETDKSVEWQGAEAKKPAAFKGGHTGNHIEVTFSQAIKSVNDAGNGIAEITIEQVKYLGKVRDSVVLEFDSSREKDKDSPLSKLIGQGYTIEISPQGRLVKLIDAAAARAAVKGATSAHTTADRLLSEPAIESRHTIAALDGAAASPVKAGATWSNVVSSDFGMMGSKSHERVYTVEQIADQDGRRIAVAQMNGIPSSEMAQQLHAEQGAGLFAKMFDNTETYTGSLRFDGTAGKVIDYNERLQVVWIAAEPPSGQPDEKPNALKMTALRAYHIEQLN